MHDDWLTLLDARVPRYTSYPTAPHFHRARALGLEVEEVAERDHQHRVLEAAAVDARIGGGRGVGHDENDVAVAQDGARPAGRTGRPSPARPPRP